MHEGTTQGRVLDPSTAGQQAISQDEGVSGPEKLMLWLFLVWFVFFAMILLGGLIGSFLN